MLFRSTAVPMPAGGDQTLTMLALPGAGDATRVEASANGYIALSYEGRRTQVLGAPPALAIDFAELPLPALSAMQASGLIAVSDDSGLCVEALGGELCRRRGQPV